MINSWGLYLAAGISPYFLWFIEKIIPYPFFIEELFKLLISTTTSKGEFSLIRAFFASLFFTISESVLYFLQFNLLGNWIFFMKRTFFTLLLHFFTWSLIMFGLTKKEIVTALFFLFAIIIHYFYNSYSQAFFVTP